jgi:hypothetical protein
MTLASTTMIDKVEVLANGILQVREAEIITKDNVEISQSYKRWTLNPTDSLEGQDSKVVAIANAVWTDEVKSAYRAMIEAQQSTLGA